MCNAKIIVFLMCLMASPAWGQFHPDAQRFIIAVQGGGDVVDGKTAVAINHFVMDLHGSVVDGGTTYTADNWTPAVCIYPMVLSTATAHAFNLKQFSSATGSYGLTFVGSPTHTANGVQTNGTSSYINTNATGSNIGTTSSTGAAWYVKATGTKTTSTDDWGALVSSNYTVSSIEGAARSDYRWFIGAGENNFCGTAAATSAPYLLQGDNDGTTTRMWKGGVSDATFSNNLSGTSMGTTKIYIGCQNIPSLAGGSTPSNYANITVTTFILRGHITTSAMTDEYNAIVSFNNLLSR